MNSPSLRWDVFLAVIVSLSGALPGPAALPQVFSGSSASSSFLVDGVGTLSAWGDNTYGCLGIGGLADQSDPAIAPFPPGVRSWTTVASAGGFYGNWTYAIGDNQQLYAAGFLSFSDPQKLFFTPVPPPAGVGGWRAVAVSDQGWLAVATNGPIYGNINGPVSWPPRPGATHWTQVAVRSYFSPTELDLFALDNLGKLYGVYSGTAWFSSPTFVEIPVPTGATAWTNITAGTRFVFALADDGDLYAWGHNDRGQLGLGSKFAYYTNAPQRVALPAGKTGWKAIAAGNLHALAITTDGQLFVSGYNGYGQLGLGANAPDQYDFTAVPNLTNVTAIAAGYWHSMAVANCQVLAWGGNVSGELGVGFTSAFYPLPLASLLTYDLCSTNPPLWPVVSIAAVDPVASEGTWRTRLHEPATNNSGRFEVSRVVASASSLEVKLAIGGTASSGVDYVALPSTITIPAHSNSVSVFVFPTGSTLGTDPATVTVALVPEGTYQFGNPTNATVALLQYESEPAIPFPVLSLQLFVGTNLNGQVFVVQSSTNLTDWIELGTATNVWGVVSVTEPNPVRFRQRFFRTFPLSVP